MITDKFAQHFCRSYSYNNKGRADSLYQQYIRARSDYNGSPLASHSLDTELVSRVIGDMHGGKAPDTVGLTVEHLQPPLRRGHLIQTFSVNYVMRPRP